mgnify:CR=1 FL=1
MIGNEWFNQKTGKSVYCVEDSSVRTVGSDSKAGLMSPKNLLVSTITDQLKIANNFESKTIGIALKDRGSILPAGHTANAAYWFDSKNGAWITSSFYMNDFYQLKNTDLKTVSEKIATLNSNKRWIKDKEGEWHMKNGDNSISKTTPYGTTHQNGDYIQSNLSTSIQNYKNNFVPSISLGFDLVFNNGINKKYTRSSGS